MLVRRDELRASKIMAKRVLDNPKIEMAWNTEIQAYQGDSKLEKLVLINNKTKESRVVEVGGLFMAIGHEPLTKGLDKTGLELDAEGYIVAKNHVFTNIDVPTSMRFE